MEFASRLRWIILIAVVTLVLILVGWGMFSIARNLFTGQSTSSSEIEAADARYEAALASTARFITEGPVVANVDHRSYTIDVSANVVSMKVYAQYGDKVIDSVSYTNTAESYDNFLRALDGMSVTDRIKGTNEEDDYNDKGVCPNGRRHILEFDSDFRRWSTSCNTKQGTAGFSMSQVRDLFKKQVPDYADLTRSTGL